MATQLAGHYGWEVEFEAVDNNPYLASFYEDMARWSFHLTGDIDVSVGPNSPW